MYVIKLKSIILCFIVLMGIVVSSCIIGTRLSARATGAEANGVQLPIIMYHSVLKDTSKSGKYVITPDQLEEDMKYLQENNYTTIVMQDLIDYAYEGKELPEKPIMLTFDDGYYNNYVYAYPLLQQYNMRAVISIVGEYTDLYTENHDDNANYAHLTWDNVNEMMKSGYVEIQNHTYKLHSLKKGRTGCKKKSGESIESYTKLLNEDVGGMQAQIKEHTGYTPTTFTYPFGGVSNASFQIIKDMGFQASLSCQEGINVVTGDKEELYMLKRCLRPHDKGVKNILNQ